MNAITPICTRPVLRWHGGKWRLAPWIVAQFPPHRIYVEPFGGAASVLLRKPRTYAEVYNDLDAEAVNLFRVLRAPETAARLIDLLRLTPFARPEFLASYESCDDPVERARRLVVRSYQGFGGNAAACDIRTGFRSASNRTGTTPAHDWANLPDALAAVVERLRGVVIEQDDAVAVMRRHDAADALHYVDPPYLPATRSAKTRRGGAPYHAYRHELSEADHVALAAALHELAGAVVLSGYPSPLYDRLYADWRRLERRALADGARPRTEVLWLSPAACRGQTTLPLGGAA